MRAAGTVLVLLGGALALRSALLLAGRGRPQRGPRPAFVIAGPYRRMRNPLLGGLLIAGVGALVAMPTGALLVLVGAAAVAAHLWVVRVEEPRLTARFGRAYDAYVRAVPRWWPRASAARDDDGL